MSSAVAIVVQQKEANADEYAVNHEYDHNIGLTNLINVFSKIKVGITTITRSNC